MLNARLIRDRLHGRRLGENVTVLGETGSTNDEVRRRVADGDPADRVVIAASQSAGRGRLGRAWYSAPEVGLYVSVFLRPNGAPGLLPRWTLGAAYAAASACREITSCAVAIEWPNDLVVDGRKLGGVLAESRTTAGRGSDLVVGVGLNVNHEVGDFPEDIADIATSLRIESHGAIMEREAVAVGFLTAFGRVADVLDDGDWPTVLRSWSRLAAGIEDAPVRVTSGTGRSGFEGVTAGVDDAGALRVRRNRDGAVVLVHSGESVIYLATPETRD